MPVLYNGLHKWRLYNILLIGHKDSQALNDNLVQCSLHLSNVTISGCRKDVCFAIGKLVATSYHDYIYHN